MEQVQKSFCWNIERLKRNVIAIEYTHSMMNAKITEHISSEENLVLLFKYETRKYIYKCEEISEKA